MKESHATLAEDWARGSVTVEIRGGILTIRTAGEPTP